MLLLLYRECYGFETAFFTFRHFLSYTPSSHLVQALPQTAFVKVSLEAGSSPFKVAGLPTAVQNTDLTHLFGNHTVLHKHTDKKEFYVNISKYVDKLLVMKS